MLYEEIDLRQVPNFRSKRTTEYEEEEEECGGG